MKTIQSLFALLLFPVLALADGFNVTTSPGGTTGQVQYNNAGAFGGLRVTLTNPATGATLTLADGKTLTASNTLTLVGTDGSTLNIGAGGTLGTAAYTASTAYLSIGGGTLTGNLLFTDNTYDIGASGATRPRTGWFGTQVGVGSTSAMSTLQGDGVYIGSTTQNLGIARPAQGVLRFTETNDLFSRVCWGGTTASYPALKRNGTAFNVRLADDSADAPITASTITASGNIAISTAGTTLSIKSGANAKAGTFTLSSGTVTVANTSVTANSVVCSTVKTSSGTLGTGSPEIVITSGTGFTATGIATDNSTYNFVILEVN